MKLGFIGLGQMGSRESLNLIKAGFDLIVYDIDARAVEPIVSAGAKFAGSPKEVAQICRTVIICLASAEAVEKVTLGENGIFDGAKAGDILIDVGTTEPLLIKKINDIAMAKKIILLDAPVAGGVTGARDATLTVMVGGDKESFQRCSDIFHAIGKNVFYVGESGNGMIVKIVNNCIGIANIALFTEALVLGVKAGIDAKTLYEIIKTGSGNSYQFEKKTPRILKRDFEPTASMDVAYKDLLLAHSLARRLKVPLNVTSAAIQAFEEARALHFDDQDMLAVIKVSEKFAGVEVKEVSD